MSDICDRLMRFDEFDKRVCTSSFLEIEAAAEIERLRAENEKLRAALKPFADAAADFIAEKHDMTRAVVALGDLRAAAAAIREAGE